MKKVLIIRVIGTLMSICLIVIFNLIFLNRCSNQNKQYSINSDEVLITLNKDFSQSGSFEFSRSDDSERQYFFANGVVFQSATAAIHVFRWLQNSLYEFNEFSLTEFANACAENLNYDDEKKLCFTSESAEKDYYKQEYFFKTKIGYYEFIVYYTDSNDTRVEKWMESVSFNEEKIFDIDKTIREKKTVVLDETDNATIQIDSNLCRLKNKNAYRTISLNRSYSIYDVEFTKIPKSETDCVSLEEYASSLNYTKRKYQSENYIVLTKTRWLDNYSSAIRRYNLLVVYCFESQHNFYTMEIISTNETPLDDFADTFSANEWKET